jgi:hypothetical protein
MQQSPASLALNQAAGMLACVTDLAEDRLDFSVSLRCMTAVVYLTKVGATPTQVQLAPNPVAISAALREALRLLGGLPMDVLGLDPVLDAIAEVQRAHEAAG